MNIKNLRKDYHLLSKRERHSILHAAFIRNDTSEVKAVHAASPKIQYQGSDLSDLASLVNFLHYVNLLERIGHADLVSDISHLLRSATPEKLPELLQTTFVESYLYVVETDAWERAGAEFGIDVRGYREMQARQHIAAKRLNGLDDLLRDWAFSEEEFLELYPESNWTVSNVAESHLKLLHKIEKGE